MKQILLSCSFLWLISTHLLAQGIAINEDNSSPDGSAILDIKSTSKGMLIPRMTKADREAISSPATALMVYQTDNDKGFYYYENSTWNKVGLLSGTIISTDSYSQEIVDAGYTLYGVQNITLDNIQSVSVTADSWLNTSNVTNTAELRSEHTAIWTGTEMIIWGGVSSAYLDTGAKYNPTTDSWTSIETTDAPDARGNHTAIWTGTEMIIWGGNDFLFNFNTGARYNPTTDTWLSISTSAAPSARSKHTVVWTGTEMIIWGGSDGTKLNTGARYNLSSGTWSTMSTTNAPSAREGHTAVWTGAEMIVWGGNDNTFSNVNTGAKYNPTTDTWTTITTVNAPDARRDQTAIWTGTEMIIWGGAISSFPFYLGSGAKYNPTTDTWTTITTTSARTNHKAVWTGNEMIIWGGFDVNTYNRTNTGSMYNPTTDAWTVINTTDAPTARIEHTAVWTGTEMIIWGGSIPGFTNTGGRYYLNSQTGFNNLGNEEKQLFYYQKN